jgi:N-formylglutamate amidohydrolase
MVLNSPHSGSFYPPAFLAQSRLDAAAIRKSEDFFVDDLFGGAVDLGAPMLRANFPRAYLDVNREPYELDPKMFCDSLPPYANSQSLRVGGGLGTIPRIVGDGMEIYRQRLPASEALERVETIYRPYHASLRGLVASARARFGKAVLLDCHSMPGSIRIGERGTKADIIIGDRFGGSASRQISDAALTLLRGRGFAVAHNKPYAGGFITEHYGKPRHNVHALQIEVNRSLYVDEQSYAKLDGFLPLKRAITGFIADMMDYVGGDLLQTGIAAE